MELKESILKRKSIRRYHNRPVDMKLLGEILETARFAPSAGNIQNWQFVIVTEEEKKNEIAKASLDQHWMTQAPAYIIICNQYKKVTNLYGKLGRMFSIQDCAIIATYIMLLAKEKGLDTCWIGAFDNEALQRILELPSDADPEIILTIGYSAETNHEEALREDIKNLTYFEKWGNTKAIFPEKSVTQTLSKIKEKLPSKNVLGKIKGLLKK